MRVSREQMAENRERILDTAATLFRERGFDGVGVADVMKAVGLTHGGFYGHFSSKDDLAAQALGRAFVDSNRWAAEAKATEPQVPLRGIVNQYLSPAHRDDAGHGCPVAALGSEVARQGGASRLAATEGVRAAIKGLSAVAPGATADERRASAIASYATLVGALVLARMVDDAALSDEILAAGRAALCSAET
ncbi:TetR/AcrR family transcriptional regulator, transcriptional repressor for nem operon [Bosea sp. CRIB-10]|uniref:TetR/AcrR family transcriptional regulator n=1 Tax=Bosea sp. CRIB-10 TaxID=378404 RepID=UPI0008E6FED6|nr:TetR/AcrR family transcriptional regulator [Bosea sp. CRIB-10]SFD35716.1 TetR/AcrR family transcriptional regulator, transcriptional repressor for nem operon [Bosea sp. CRIB-10]